MTPERDLVLDRRFQLDFHTAFATGPARPHGMAFKWEMVLTADSKYQLPVSMSLRLVMASCSPAELVSASPADKDSEREVTL